MWAGYIIGRVWSLGQVSVEALGSGIITSRLVTGQKDMGLVFIRFGAYVFIIALEFGDTALWPLVSSVSGRWQHAGRLYSWVCSSHQEEPYLEWLGGVAISSRLGMACLSGRVMI